MTADEAMVCHGWSKARDCVGGLYASEQPGKEEYGNGRETRAIKSPL